MNYDIVVEKYLPPRAAHRNLASSSMLARLKTAPAASVQVQANELLHPPVIVNTGILAPGIFTVGGTGSGQRLPSTWTAH